RRGLVRDTGNGFVQRMAIILVMVTLTLFAAGHRPGEVHQDPCHRRHACPSDHPTDICGDQGRCDQCPDYQFCLARKPRLAASPAPAPVLSNPAAGATTTSSAVTVCFIPGGNCTDAIVNALSDAKRAVLVQAYAFTMVIILSAGWSRHIEG